VIKHTCASCVESVAVALVGLVVCVVSLFVGVVGWVILFCCPPCGFGLVWFGCLFVCDVCLLRIETSRRSMHEGVVEWWMMPGGSLSLRRIEDGSRSDMTGRRLKGSIVRMRVVVLVRNPTQTH
jgi:hypothetical protein